MKFVQGAAITDKADGERKQILVTQHGVFLLNPFANQVSMYMYDEDEFHEWKNTIVDGELIDNLKGDKMKKQAFLCFDSLFMKGIDVRERQLTERLDIRTRFNAFMSFKSSDGDTLGDVMCFINKFFFFKDNFHLNVYEAFKYINGLP